MLCLDTLLIHILGKKLNTEKFFHTWFICRFHQAFKAHLLCCLIPFFCHSFRGNVVGKILSTSSTDNEFLQPLNVPVNALSDSHMYLKYG